jgi:hypothetical protein
MPVLTTFISELALNMCLVYAVSYVMTRADQWVARLLLVDHLLQDWCIQLWIMQFTSIYAIFHKKGVYLIKLKRFSRLEKTFKIKMKKNHIGCLKLKDKLCFYILVLSFKGYKLITYKESPSLQSTGKLWRMQICCPNSTRNSFSIWCCAFHKFCFLIPFAFMSRWELHFESWQGVPVVHGKQRQRHKWISVFHVSLTCLISTWKYERVSLFLQLKLAVG